VLPEQEGQNANAGRDPDRERHAHHPAQKTRLGLGGPPVELRFELGQPLSELRIEAAEVELVELAQISSVRSVHSALKDSLRSLNQSTRVGFVNSPGHGPGVRPPGTASLATQISARLGGRVNRSGRRGRGAGVTSGTATGIVETTVRFAVAGATA